MSKILTADGPTGSGKTNAAAQTIVRLVQDDQTILLTQPTKELNHATAKLLRSLYPQMHIELINGDTYPNKVVQILSERLQRPYDRGHVILTTFESFDRLPFLCRPERYHFVCDEIPNGLKSCSEIIPRNHRRLTDALSVVSQGPSYGRIVVEDKGHVRAIAENVRRDAIDAILQPFARSILDLKRDTFVNVEQYEALRRGSLKEEYLRTFSLLKPRAFDGFQSVRMIGARAHETVLFKWFSRQGVMFEDDDEITSKLRYREHNNGDLIDFHYGSETNWSFYGQEQDPEIRNRIIEAAKNLLKDRRFVWLDSKRFEDGSEFKAIDGNRILPHGSHGRNDFQDEDNAIILTALNHNPYDSAFLEDMVGMSRDEQKVAFDYHNTYQTLTRTSIRNPNNSNRKIIILPDRQNAEWQQQVFPGSRIHSLNVDDRTSKKRGRVKQYESSTERKRAQRQRNKEEQERLIEKFDLGGERILDAGFHMSCHNISYESLRQNVTTYQGSIVRDTFDGMSFPFNMENKDFGIYLNGLHKNTYPSKESNQLIMPGLCVPVQNIDTERGFENALFGRHIYLDIDGGDLKHRRLSEIFPHVEMIVYNSYNHTPEKPRYRVVLLTDGLVSPTVYKFLWRQVVQRIENSGYHDNKNDRPKGVRKHHGIDNKPNIVNLFYLPCQPKEGKGFYYHYKKNRKPLCINDWIDNAIPTRFDDDVAEERITVESVSREVANSNEIIQVAMERYRQFINNIDPQTGKLGSSNKALFVLNQNLIRSGTEYWDRDITLTQAANESRSPKDRLKDKDRYMKRR